MNQQSYYAVIPANVRYSKEVSDGAKLLYGEITALSNQNGYCWATNKYFADLYGKSSDTVSRWISELSAAGFIVTLVDSSAANSRKIWLAGSPGVSAKMPTPIGKNASTLSAKMPTPIGKNAEQNNTVNTTLNTTLKNNAGASDPLSPPFQKVDEIYPETFGLEAGKENPLHRGPGAVRVSITDPEFPGVTVVEELAPGPKTRNGRKSKTQEEIDLAGRVIEYLNKAAGRNFKTNTGDNAKGIIAQSRQGYTEAQMQKVIDFKIRQWGNDVQMREHLNPVTLFRPSNFERYLSAAELPALQQAGQPKPQNFQTRSHINNAGGDLDRYNEPQIF